MTVSTLPDPTTWTDDTGRTWSTVGAVTLVVWEELSGYIRVVKIL